MPKIKHDAIVQPVGKRHQAYCTCGWSSRLVSMEHVARRQLRDHLKEVSTR